MTKKLLLIALISLFSLQIFSQNRLAEYFKHNHGIEINDDANDNLDIVGDFTFECWIYVKHWEDEAVIFYRESSYGLELELPSNGNGDFGLVFGKRDATDNIFFTISTSGYADLLEQTWYHVALIASGNDLKLYINGDLANSSGWIHFTPSSNPVYLGAKHRNSTWSNHFFGYIDEVRFSSYARNIDDLTTSMYAEEYVIDANTVFLMDFNDTNNSTDFETSTGLINDTYSLSHNIANLMTPPIQTPLFPKYRSIQSGNWEDLSTWEVEYEENNYTTPNFIPSRSAFSNTISSNHTVSINSEISSTSVYISSNANLIINDSLWVYPTTYNDGLLTINPSGGFYLHGSFDITASGHTDVYGSFTILSDVTNLAGPSAFVIKSTATTQGSLIVDREIDITIEKYIEGYSSADDGWHLISSPIGNFTPTGTDFEPGSNDDLYKWDGNTNIWKNYKDSNFGIYKANGYLCSYEQTETKEFIGTTWFQYHCWSGPSSSVKWILEGNVFPSAVIWNDGNWELSGASTTAKLWDESSGNYQDITSGDIIPAMQGFFVETEIGNFRLRFNEDSRTHSTTPWYKSTKTYDNSFIIKISGGENSFSDKTRITFNSDATLDYDNEYDSHKLDGAASAPQIYSLNYSAEQFSTQQIPPSLFDTIIDIRVKTPAISNYKIELSDYTLIQEKEIILEDRNTNKFINLSQWGSYEFLSASTEISHRFRIHIGKTTGVENMDTLEENILAFYKNNQLYIQAINQGMQEISLWNTNGQQVYSQKINTNQNQSLNINIASGIYVLRINNLAQKIFIQ